MKISLPALADIQRQLSDLNHAALQELADASSVPFTTLMKIRQGYTKNPGLETIRKILPALKRVNRPVKPQPLSA